MIFRIVHIPLLALAGLLLTAAYQPASIIHVPNDTVLSRSPAIPGSSIIRDGFAALGDSPPLLFTASGSACSITGSAVASISGNTLTVSSAVGKPLYISAPISGAGIASGTVVTALGTGTGGTGTYTVSASQTVGSETITITGDGGSQVVSSDNKCWLAQFPPGPLAPSWFGVFGGPLVFNVDNLSGNDFSGANYCIRGACKTAVQGLAKCFEFQLFNGGLNQYVLATGGTYNETLNWDVGMVSAPGTAGETDGGCGFVGATNTLTSGGVGDTILAGDVNQCGVAIATGVGSGWLRNVKVTALNNACQSGIYTQEGGHMQTYDGVTTGPANVCKILSEESGSQLNTWNDIHDVGNANYWDCLSNKGQLVINGNQTITEIGTPVYSVAYWSLTGNADIQIGGGTVFTGAVTGLMVNADTGGMVRNNTSPLQWPHTTTVPLLRGGARVFPEIADPICTLDGHFGSTEACVFNQKGSYSGQVQITPGGTGISSSGVIEITLPMTALSAAGSGFPLLGYVAHGWPSGFTLNDGGFTINANGTVNWFLSWTGVVVSGTPVFINYFAGG